ncbi:GNAT family N-acetyltransferase [Aquimarina gracilis]|uniref:GNAT family N-acetyltransferase n=1 Tax=Aquimarina gracilis TaxID=874422 RepID=A0ABU6A194_9FLAO|nr:GNAT family N-acetyltransferase [Aquimarina gracilis]MEB3347820.1 GNAT family N-acetyltransferase [Aquimarina gracilis]
MEIKFVKAQEEDKAFFLNLRKQTMNEHLEKAGIYLSEEEHKGRVDKNYDGSYIISNSFNKLGLLKYIEEDTRIEILQLQILPKFQGNGIGKQVLNKMISKAETMKKDLFLKVLKDNPAKHLYRRCGFKIIGEDNYEFFMQRSNITA